MSRPISSRISPPAISKAGSVIPNSRKISCPPTAKLVSTMKQVSAPLRAIRLRRAGSAPSVIAKNDGIAANGSTRKKIELSASTEKRTSGAVLSSFKPPRLDWSRPSFEARPFGQRAASAKENIDASGLTATRIRVSNWNRPQFFQSTHAFMEGSLHLRHLSLLSLASISCCVAPLCARTGAPGTQGPVPLLKENVRAVVVDVVVTKGEQPVAGLHQQDFQVIEDGKPQTIDFFEEHLAKTLPPGALPAMPQMPPNVYTNVPPAPESDSVNVLLLDSLNTEKPDQAYVHQQILNFLKTMPPGVRCAIFMLGSKLRFVQGFTTDTSVLIAALTTRRTEYLLKRTRRRGRAATHKPTKIGLTPW